MVERSSLYKVALSNGTTYEIHGTGYASVVDSLGLPPYTVPPGSVVGIEGPRGGAKFYKKHNKVLFPISAHAAAVETHLLPEK